MIRLKTSSTDRWRNDRAGTTLRFQTERGAPLRAFSQAVGKFAQAENGQANFDPQLEGEW